MTKTRREALLALGSALAVACEQRRADSAEGKPGEEPDSSRPSGRAAPARVRIEMPSRVLFPEERAETAATVILTELDLRGSNAALSFEGGKTLEVDARLSFSDLLGESPGGKVRRGHVVIKRIVAFVLDELRRTARRRFGAAGVGLREDFVALQTQVVLESASISAVHGLVAELDGRESVSGVRWSAGSAFLVE